MFEPAGVALTARGRDDDGSAAVDQDGDSGHDDALPSLYAYEEQPPHVAARETVLAEQLAALRRFAFAPPEAVESDATGGLAYLDACARQHRVSCMTAPTHSVAMQLRRNTETLDLAYAGLGVKGCIALAAALRVNVTATTLVLTGNYMTPSSARTLARAMAESRTVTSLDLSSNRLGSVEMDVAAATRTNNSNNNNNGAPTCASTPLRGGAVVSELVAPGVSALTHLRLRDNGLGDADVALFADTVAENTVLQVMDLAYNKIGYLGACELAKMLARNGDLREINLEGNCFGVAGSMQLLSDGFLLNNTIKTFNLSSCGLTDACALLLARVMAENATEDMYVANNRIGPVGAEALATGLRATSSLCTLVLDGNPLLDAGCAALLDVAHSGDAKTLRVLSLCRCSCSAAMERRVCGGGSSNVTHADVLVRLSCSCGTAY